MKRLAVGIIAILCKYVTLVSLRFDFALSSATSLTSSAYISDTAFSDNIQEFCTGETFQPRCTGNDVVVIVSARYGRMKVGRCLEVDPGFRPMMQDSRFLGCSDDVTSIVSSQCSGQPQCSVRVNDQTFSDIQSCYSTLKMYMEVTFVCIKVAAETRYCTVQLSGEPQHIVGKSRQHSTAVGCGDKSQPWTVETLAGQRIAVSLIDFTDTSTGRDGSVTIKQPTGDRSGECVELYGHVIERNIRQNVSMCRHEQQTELRRVYTSTTNQLQISINSHNNFIIHLQAVGCSDLSPPSDVSWLKRVDDQIVVGCYLSRQSWQLRCVDGVWVGTVGVCVDNALQQTDEVHEREETSWSSVVGENHFATLLIVAVSCAGVALCSVVVFVGVYCLRRQGKGYKEKTVSTTLKSYDNPTDGPPVVNYTLNAGTLFDGSLQCHDQLQHHQLQQQHQQQQPLLRPPKNQ